MTAPDNVYDYYARAYSSSYTWAVRFYQRVNNSNLVAYYSVSDSGDGAWNDIEADAASSSLWVPNHGLSNGDIVTVSATTGTLPGGLNTGSSYIAKVVSSNRLAFIIPGSSEVSFTDVGSTNLVYRVQCTKPNTLANTITISGNTLQDASAITYDKNSGTLIGGLTDLTTYFTAFKVGDAFKLSTTQNPYSTVHTLSTVSYTHLTLPTKLEV